MNRQFNCDAYVSTVLLTAAVPTHAQHPTAGAALPCSFATQILLSGRVLDRLPAQQSAHPGGSTVDVITISLQTRSLLGEASLITVSATRSPLFLQKDKRSCAPFVVRQKSILKLLNDQMPLCAEWPKRAARKSRGFYV
jgi:hypothetical protein